MQLKYLSIVLFSLVFTFCDEKYWYDNDGMLVKFENRYFGDMKKGECLLTYNNQKKLVKIEINEIVKDVHKYKYRTVLFKGINEVTLLTHNNSK
jgi:hypothetical protein